jgi:hypothetical protein
VTGKNQILVINNRTEALPIGVQATLRLLPYLQDPILKQDPIPFYATLTYRWARDVYSQRDLSWFQSDLTYNLDPAGHFAIGFSYKRGDDQDTGAFANVYRLGLTGKL